jgi:Ca-activated chloride channel family protein
VRIALVMLTMLSIPTWWRETSSHAASRRGARAYEAQQYGAAEESYRRAQQLAPSPRNAFNLGTSEIAAGHREQGSADLSAAMRDPALRADALFNRGNSALAAKAYDHAVRDYIDALRANPNHAGAKRNLEIALQRRDAALRPDTKGKPEQKGQTQPKPSAAEGQKPKEGDLDLEALLRSVQQQEQEELRRMKVKPAEGKVGW